MWTGSKLLRETSLLSDRCVRVPETSTNAETMIEESEIGLIIALDADGLVETNTVAAPKLIAGEPMATRSPKGRPGSALSVTLDVREVNTAPDRGNFRGEFSRA